MSAPYPTAREIAEKLKGRKLGEGRFVACCPAHPDASPSLSIVDGRIGRPVFHCFARCHWRDVSDALAGLGLDPQFERGRQSASARRAPAPTRSPLVDGRALALWRSAAPIDRTPADLYLRARGFASPYPATLRYLPGRGDHPHALIAALGLPGEPEPGLLHIPDSAVRAVHLTRLDPTGTKRRKTDDAKIIVGQGALGLPVTLTPINDGLGLLIAKGSKTRSPLA
jgi:hypothetical protein